MRHRKHHSEISTVCGVLITAGCMTEVTVPLDPLIETDQVDWSEHPVCQSVRQREVAQHLLEVHHR